MTTHIIKKETAPRQAAFGSSVVDQIFQSNLTRFFDDSFWGFDGGSLSRNQLPVNVRDAGKSYEMELIAPGLKKQDFHLNVAGTTLTVSCECKKEARQENKTEGWLRQEYKKQSFSRSFNLDATVDATKIAARYEDGVLYLSLPKKESTQMISRAINIL